VYFYCDSGKLVTDAKAGRSDLLKAISTDQGYPN